MVKLADALLKPGETKQPEILLPGQERYVRSYWRDETPDAEFSGVINHIVDCLTSGKERDEQTVDDLKWLLAYMELLSWESQYYDPMITPKVVLDGVKIKEVNFRFMSSLTGLVFTVIYDNAGNGDLENHKVYSIFLDYAKLYKKVYQNSSVLLVKDTLLEGATYRCGYAEAHMVFDLVQKARNRVFTIKIKEEQQP